MYYPFPLSQCQPLSSLEFERANWDHWIMEPKMDGWRMQFQVTPTRCQAWTRSNKDATGKMPYIEKELTELGSFLRLDGEVVWLNANDEPDYNYTARCLGSSTDVCVMKQNERIGGLVYYVFDIMMVETVDITRLTLKQRKLALKTHLSNTDHVQIVMGYEPSIERHVKNFETFYEGSVLKDLRAAYAGRRYKSWLKFKEIETISVKIIGYKPGQGKFISQIGAIMWEDPATGVKGFCSGMDDDTRAWISDNALSLVGKWIEIKHYGKLVDGYRHPQFQRFREDLV